MSIRAIEQIRSHCLEVLDSQRAAQLSALKGETLTILGGTGFVGTWLAEMITTLNDVHSFGTQAVLIARSVDHFKKLRPHLAERKDIQLIKADVRYTAEIPKDTNWLIHAAASPDSRFHSVNPVETMTVIGNGTESALRAVDRCSNFKMFLYLSSGLVYGPQPLDHARISESFLGAPRLGSVSGIYAESKRYAEMLCTSFRSQFRIPTAVARPFAFVGPYQSLTSPWAVNNFIADSIAGKAIRVLGDGSTVRSYMYPTDMAYWLLRILTGAQSGDQYNLGSPEAVELRQLAQMISHQCLPHSEVIFSAGSNAVPNRSRLVPDVTAAIENLGLSITVPLETALTRTIEWNKLTQEFI